MIFNKFKNIATVAMTFMAAAVMSSCQTPDIAQSDAPEKYNGVTLNFSSENEVGTKTEWTGKTIIWSAGDAMSMAYSVDGAWNNTVYPSAALETATAVANFSVPTDLQSDATGEFVFAAVYPSSAIASTLTDSKAVVTVPSNQTASAATFDKAADVMVGHSVETYASVPTESIPMLWDRKVAHVYLTLTSLSLAYEETLSNVVITAQEGAALSGEFAVDMTTGEMTTQNASNSVTVDVSSLSVDDSGRLSFWATVAPLKATSLMIQVNTSVATYERVITPCSIDFLANSRNELEVKMSNLPNYPVIYAHRGCWFDNDVPENSLSAVRMAKRFGYVGIELDVRPTSDGKYMVIHDQSLNRTMRNASDYSEITETKKVADLTYEEIRANYVMASDNEDMREPLPTLEEMLRECKNYGLKVMMHTHYSAAYDMAHEIMGDGNWIAFNSRDAALNYARKIGLTGTMLYSIDEEDDLATVMTNLEGWGKPCGITTMEASVLTPENIKMFTDAGFEVQASVLSAPKEWQAYTDGVTYQLTNFIVMPNQRMNNVDTISKFGVTLKAGEPISKTWETMDYGATILRIKFVGTLTIKVNGTTYTVTSDGQKEECIGKRFCNSAPSFSISASEDTEVEYYHVYLNEPTDL